MKSSQSDEPTAYTNGNNLTAAPVAELQQQLFFYAQIVEQLSDGVYIFHLEDRRDDHSFRILAANAATQTLTNVAPQQIIGHLLDEQFPNLRQHGLPQAYAEVVRTGQPFKTELVYGDEHVPESAFAINAFALSDEHVAVVFHNITQQKQAEQQRQAETDQAILVLEATGYGVWDVDIPNNRTTYNTSYAAMLGYETTTFAQTVEEWYQLVHPDDLPQIMHDFQAMLAGQIPQMNNQFRIRNRAGEWQWFESRGGVVARDAEGNALRVLGVVNDITAQKQNEQELQKLAAIIQSSPDYVSYAALDLSEVYINPAGRALTGVQPEDMQNEPNPARIIHADDLPDLTEQIMPMVMQGKTWTGEIRLRHLHEDTIIPMRGIIFPVKDAQTDQVIATAAVLRDVREQKRIEQELQKLAAVIESSPYFIGVYAPDFSSTYINPAGQQLLGLSPEAVATFNPFAPLPEEMHQQVMEEIMPQINRDGMWQGEIPVRNLATGQIFPAETTAFLVRDRRSGTPIALATFLRDISVQKQAQREIQKLAAIVENSPDYITYATLDLSEVYINPAGRELVGVTLSDLHNDYDATLPIYPEDVPIFSDQVIPRITQQGKAWTGDIRLRHVHTGTVIPTSGHAFLVKDTQTGEPIAMAAILRDMREQKRIEQEIKKLAAIVEASPDYISYASMDLKTVYINPAGRKLMGYTLDDPLINYDPLESATPETRQKFINEITPAIQTYGFWSGEIVVRSLDTGKLIPVDVTAFLITDPQTGEPIAQAGIMRDISERKRAEQEQLELQQRVIAAQRAAIHELSTPLLPLSKGVVALPIIGSVDTARAQQVMETLLEGIAHHKAHLAIVDITGVKVVDTQVAQALIRTAQAVRLLGAQVVITGIQPRIAQTLVQLGVELTGIVTRATLEDGIAYALKLR